MPLEQLKCPISRPIRPAQITFHLVGVDRTSVHARIMEHFRALRNGTHQFPVIRHQDP